MIYFSKKKTALITGSSTLINLFNNYFIIVIRTYWYLWRSHEHQKIKKKKKLKKKEETYKIAEKFYLKEVLPKEVKKIN